MIAGEASADSHAAALVREMKSREGNLDVFGVGGSELAAEGMDIWVNSEALNVVGTTDFLDRAFEIIGTYRRLLRRVQEHRPDCAVLLDLPDFNLRMAKKLKAMGVPVVYYISPQVWAWRKYRVKTIRKYVDRMLVLFPFEKDFYDKNGVDAEFVGHPLLDRIEARTEFRGPSQLMKAPRVTILPGSRISELKYHGPIVARLVDKFLERYPNAEIKIPVASTLSVDQINRAMKVDDRVQLVRSSAIPILAWADVAVVASGTATLETALVGTPFCLFYQMSRLSVWIAKYIVRYKSFLGMPNLLSKREVVKEFLAERADAELIFPECVRLLEDGEYRKDVIFHLLACRKHLGVGGASVRVAREVFSVLREFPRRVSGRLLASTQES